MEPTIDDIKREVTNLADKKAGKADVEALRKDFENLGENEAIAKKFKEYDETVQKALGDQQKDIEKLEKQLGELRQQRTFPGAQKEARPQGGVSRSAAEYLGAMAVIGMKARGAEVNSNVVRYCQGLIEKHVAINKGDAIDDHLESYRKAALEVEMKTALTTSDIPVPTLYSGDVVELVDEYGTFAKYATIFPMGGETVNLPKLTTDPTFAFIDTSGSVGEKVPQASNVAFAAKKAGGLVRVPHEIEADSIIGLGQFIARYIARNIAKWEDTTGWLADGSGTYKTMEGVVDRVVDNAKLVTLTSGNTAPDDWTLANARSLRAQVDAAILGQSAYYFNVTMESLLASFNTGGDYPYQANGVNGPSLDGFPIRWIPSLPVNSSSASVSTVVGLFGDMSYWYLGRRGGVRIDMSSDVYFATDEVGIRALWRFAVDEMATTHMAGIRTAAS